MTSIALRHVSGLAGAAILALIVACASGGGGQPAAGSPTDASAGGGSAPTKSTASVLVADDLRKTDALNLGDAIQRLRPEWLRRGSARAANTMGSSRTASEPLVVWIDNNRAGGPDILSQIQISNVRSVQYFTPSEAESRFGTGNSSGAILITTLAASKR